MLSFKGMEKRVEVEIRSFLTPERHAVLIERLKLEGEFLGEDEQVTWYFDGPQDLRIQKNRRYAKVWLKKGRMHDEKREEIEVRVAKDDFGRLAALFETLGFQVSVKWFRTRNRFRWNGIDVALDHTKGYGHIIELEKLTAPEGQDAALEELKAGLEELGVSLTSKEEFQSRFEHYRRHWRELVGSEERQPA
jgi:predicted adenylyl cyclase CyaB